MNSLNKDSIIDLRKEQETCAERFNSTLVFDRCGIGFFKTAPDRQNKQNMKRSNSEYLASKISSTIETVPAHDPNGVNELYYMNLEKILGGRLKKKMKLDYNLIDGYQHTRTPYPSPIEEKDRVLLAEKELESVEGWNQVLGSTLKKKTLEELTITDFSDNIEDVYACAVKNIETNNLVAELEDSEVDLISDINAMDLDLNMVELATHENQGKYKPLPIYPFYLNNIQLDTIMDTGAAKNYILGDIVRVLREKYPDSFCV